MADMQRLYNRPMRLRAIELFAEVASSSAARSLCYEAKRAHRRSGLIQHRHSPFGTRPETSTALSEQFACCCYRLGARSREVGEHDSFRIRGIGTICHIEEIPWQGRLRRCEREHTTKCSTSPWQKQTGDDF